MQMSDKPHPFPKSAATIRKSLAETGVVLIDYTNYRSERSERCVLPISWRFASSEWHKDEQWLMLALDLEKQANREFAMADIHSWKPYTDQKA